MKLHQNQKVDLEVDLQMVSVEMIQVTEETIRVVKEVTQDAQEVIQDAQEMIQDAQEMIQEAKEVMTLNQAEKNLLQVLDVVDASLYFKKDWPIKKGWKFDQILISLSTFFYFNAAMLQCYNATML